MKNYPKIQNSPELKKKVVFLVTAARPNFMKIAPLYHELAGKDWASPRIIHTGQHYDLAMSDSFIHDLGLPDPYINLGIGSGTHAEQVGQVMMAFEKLALEEKPELTVVVGDVNSTMACTLAASKIGLKVAHLEAGLRSFDRTMPEEINRIVTDSLADILWTPSADADENLLKEGAAPARIRRVGNIMIDSFEMLRAKIEKADTVNQLGLRRRQYVLVTLHRPSNVDDPEKMKRIWRILEDLSERIPLLFPVHPRTRKQLDTLGLSAAHHKKLLLSEPLSYIPFMKLVLHSKFIITDSGGIQEETTYLGIPCLTLRENTERPITIHQGTNRLCNMDNIGRFANSILERAYSRRSVPELWDGKTAGRVVRDIEMFFGVGK